MKPTATKLSSIKDTSKCPATPLVPTSDSQGPGSAVNSQTRTSHQLLNKTTDSITDILFSAAASNQASGLQSTRDRDEQRRNTATSSRTRSKGSDLSPLSFNSESLLDSPTLPVTSNRRSTPSPGASPREPHLFSVQHPPVTSRHHAVSDFASYLELNTKSINISHRENTPHRKGRAGHSHRLSAFPFREIFSPIPSEHVGDEGLLDFSNDETWRRPNRDNVPGRSTDFPAITVEHCDEGRMEKESAGLGNKDFVGLKKSASIPGNFLGELNQNKPDAGRQKTTSLDVPSSYIKWRTAEGRLIAAMNEDLLTGALSRLCSRSEGNIPLVLQDIREHVHGVDSKANQAENNSSLSRQFSRHVPQYLSSNCPRSPSNVASINTGRQERMLMTPTLQREQTSRTTFGFSSGTLEADMKKHAEFMSPQPPRRHGPRY